MVLSRAAQTQKRRFVGVAILLVAGSVLAGAAPAVALSSDVTTPGWVWEGVADDTSIDDAVASLSNYLGTGLTLSGFTSDAFDVFFAGSVTVTRGAVTLEPYYAPISASWVNGGLSTFTAAATADFAGGDTVTITRTLEIQGSFARWSWSTQSTGAISLPGIAIVERGELGSDSQSVYIETSTTRMVSYEDGGSDPVIGYALSGAAYSVSNGDDVVDLAFTGADTPVVTVALMEYDPCSLDAAIAAMQARVSTIDTDFGDTIEPVYSLGCLGIEAPAPVSGSTDQRLDLVESTVLETDYDYIYPGSMSDPTQGLALRVISAPAGLTFSLVADNVATDEPQVRMTGTPVEAGEVRLLLYYVDGTTLSQPLEVRFRVDLALAATGASDSMGILIGGSAAALMMAIGTLMIHRRTRRSFTAA